ncbi:hypothetical protein [Streptomyces pini]|uniref:Uncharacterized protein n=1 Tax=Streptomyces pini TaxID=1520580 RepID=A0A1I4EGE1_9ACTN|nr:hypothetical protein [Streptomyces pini]SFL04848.1 hypothetical protein SAMN05192584_11268 [Streptomyces pini]
MNADPMTRARQAIEAEEAARLEAKAEEIAAADERARQAAEREAQREKLKADAEAAMTAEGITLPDLARKFDAAVAALADLARAACNRNEVIRQHAAGLEAAQLPNAQRTPAPELLARAVVVAASEVGTVDNGLNRLASDLRAHSGPLARLTPVERADR